MHIKNAMATLQSQLQLHHPINNLIEIKTQKAQLICGSDIHVAVWSTMGGHFSTLQITSVGFRWLNQNVFVNNYDSKHIVL